MSSSVTIETTPLHLTEDQKLALEDLERWWVSKKGEHLISDDKYEQIKKLIPELKKHYSSSFMTSLQTNAEKLPWS